MCPLSILNPNSVFISECDERLEFISNGPIGAVLKVIGTQVALPLFFDAVGGDAEKGCCTCLVEDGIIVERGNG